MTTQVESVYGIAGSTTALPGDSGSYVIYQSNSTLLVSAGGHNESIDVPSGATVHF